MSDATGTVPPDPDEPMYAQLGEDGNPLSAKRGVDDDPDQNLPLADPGSYDGDNGEGIDTPEEQPGVGN